MGKYSFEEARTQAADTLGDMERRLARMNRQYESCIQHGATDSAAKLKEEVESLQQEIDCEQDVFRQAFY